VTGHFARMRVFVTYRREDSAAHAGRLHDALVTEFGDDDVFQDVTAIAPGEDFEVAIDTALNQANAVLVVIGPDWTASGPDGSSRLDDENDYVRLEITKALTREIRTIPILIRGAIMPDPTELPQELAQLTRRQAVQLRDATWRDDVEGLIRRLRGDSTPLWRRLMWIAATLVGIAAVAFGIWALLNDGPGEVTATVQGTDAWVDSGVDVVSGDQLSIDATGQVSHGASGTLFDPNGNPNPDIRANNVPGLENENHAALIGKIGENGEPFFVGETKDFSAVEDGGLFLGINDTGLFDNGGQFVVAITKTTP